MINDEVIDVLNYCMQMLKVIDVKYGDKMKAE